jgi:hypothetical protein
MFLDAVTYVHRVEESAPLRGTRAPRTVSAWVRLVDGTEANGVVFVCNERSRWTLGACRRRFLIDKKHAAVFTDVLRLK